jgi:Toastrack DUF4097
MRRTISLTFAVALIAVVAAGAARADEWTKTFSVTGKPHLTLSADNARLEVLPGAGGQIAVRVSTTGLSIPVDVRVIESQSGNDVKVEVKQTKHWLALSRGSVSVHVTVPAESDLNLETGNGGISLGAISGHLQVGTGNGQIDATGLHGNLALRTGNGAIDASGLDGSVEAHAGNGGVRVSGRFDVLRAESGRGEVEATALAGSKMASPWEVSSGVGSVTLRLPQNFSADLEGTTGVGHITVDFPNTTSSTLSGSSVHARLGNGGPSLRVHSGVGSLRIEGSGA